MFPSCNFEVVLPRREVFDDLLSRLTLGAVSGLGRIAAASFCAAEVDAEDFSNEIPLPEFASDLGIFEGRLVNRWPC